MKFSLCPGCRMSMPSKKMQRHASACCPQWVDWSNNPLFVSCPYCRAFVLNVCLVDVHLRGCYWYQTQIHEIPPKFGFQRPYERGYRPTSCHITGSCFKRLLPTAPLLQVTRTESTWSQLPFVGHYTHNSDDVDHRDWIGHLLLMLGQDHGVSPSEQFSLNLRIAWYNFINVHHFYLDRIGLQFDGGQENHWQFVLTSKFARFCVYNGVRLPSVGSFKVRFKAAAAGVDGLEIVCNVYPREFLRSNHLAWVPGKPRFISKEKVLLGSVRRSRGILP